MVPLAVVSMRHSGGEAVARPSFGRISDGRDAESLAADLPCITANRTP